LNLPGIGVFTIDPSITVPDPSDKNSQDFLQNVKFIQKSVTKPDEEFIEFIRLQTGKIRPLAESDLESFISDGKILLNIGKPFHLEGIGTLQKSKGGTYEFYPGLPLIERLENIFPEKDTKHAHTRHVHEHDYDPSQKGNNTGRTIWVVLAILVGLGAIIWGGYSLYNKNTDPEGTAARQPAVEPAAVDTIQNKVTDTVSLKPDSSTITVVSTKPYKFIFRVGSKNYIINRYNDLKTSDQTLFWDTKDSLTYRLYVALPVAATDTMRIRDSLKEWYGSKKIIIEQ
jgi:hypothetical protein